MVSKTYISDRQISIINNPNLVVSTLPRTSITGIQIPVIVPTTIKIDFVDKGTREVPFINQILVGPNVKTVEIITIDENNVRNVETIDFPTLPGIVTINKNLTSVEITIIKAPDQKTNVMVNLQVIGCYKEIETKTTLPTTTTTTTTTTTKKPPTTTPSQTTTTGTTTTTLPPSTTTHSTTTTTTTTKSPTTTTTKSPTTTIPSTVTQTPSTTITSSTSTVKRGGCLVDGNHFDNHQTINSTSSPDKCSSRFCYCEGEEVKCQSRPETTICQEGEVKVCNKPNPDLTCCTCIKNVTELYCQIDYLCNAQCGVCIDGIDAWGKETIIKKSEQCICKDGYLSYIESTEAVANGKNTTKIIAKCMSSTNDNSDCGTTMQQSTSTASTTTTTASTTTKSTTTTTGSTTTKSTTTETPTTTTGTTTTTTTMPPSTLTPSTTTTTTTTTSTPARPTVSEVPKLTELSTTVITSSVQTTIMTEVIPAISTASILIDTTTRPVTREERNCYFFFCESVTCFGECTDAEGRRANCESLSCGGAIEVKRNETHIFCTRDIAQNCSSIIILTTIIPRPVRTTLIPSTAPTSPTTVITTTPAMCVLISCSKFTCSETCEDEEIISKECDSLRCEIGKILIKKNQTHLWCSNSMEQNCGSSTISTTPLTSVYSTTPVISECEPVLRLNTEEFISQATSSSNQDGLKLEKWMSSTTDIVPQFELILRNTMKLIQLDMFNVSNIKRMQILTSEDGKYYVLKHFYQGGFSTLERYLMFNFTNLFVLSIKIIVYEKYQTSLGVVMSLNVQGCGKVCQPPMIHVKCLCQQTCDSLANNKGFAKCPKSCFPGCECPEGMVNENGKCIKVTECPCFYKGRSYAFGDKISTDDPCKQLVCTKESLQEVALENCTNVCKETMQPCPCDGCHKTCDKNNLKDNCDLNSCKSGCCCPTGTIYSEVLQKCVKHCPCIYENTTYNIGANWTNHCLKCTCDPERGAFCKEDGCNFDTCPQRQKMVNVDPNDNVCCKCVPIDPICTFNRKDYEVGEIWNDGPCRTYKCIMDNGKPTVTTETVTCEQIQCSDSEQMIMVAGKCCPTCVPRNFTTTFRVQTTTPYIITTTIANEKCHIVYESKTMKQNNCVSVEPFQFGSCEGLCFGRSKLVGDNGNYTVSKECTCCQPELGSVNIEYKCSDGIKLLQTTNVIGCKCNECS